jgi:hypothetical protein
MNTLYNPKYQLTFLIFKSPQNAHKLPCFLNLNKMSTSLSHKSQKIPSKNTQLNWISRSIKAQTKRWKRTRNPATIASASIHWKQITTARGTTGPKQERRPISQNQKKMLEFNEQAKNSKSFTQATFSLSSLVFDFEGFFVVLIFVWFWV